MEWAGRCGVIHFGGERAIAIIDEDRNVVVSETVGNHCIRDSISAQIPKCNAIGLIASWVVDFCSKGAIAIIDEDGDIIITRVGDC